jgi:hypothetical protein
MGCFPLPREAAKDEVIERSSDICELWYKLPIAVHIVKDGMYSGGVFGFFLYKDGFNLLYVYFDAGTCLHDEPQVFHFGDIEGALS